jgi:hypothetical protein
MFTSIEFYNILTKTHFKMKKGILLSFVALGLLASCEVQDNSENLMEEQKLVVANVMENMVSVSIDMPKATQGLSSKKGADLKAQASLFNEMLIPYGVQLEKMEYYTADGAGNTVFFNDRGNKQLGSDYVPNDPRNALPGTAVPYLIDGTQLTTASGLNTLAPLNTVRETWSNVTCSSGLEVQDLGVTPTDVGFVSNIFFGFGGSNGFFPGVIVQAGMLPSAFFDALAPGGGNGILGVCFTLVWNEDINNDGKGDVAIKEIYYNNGFNWQDRVATGTGFDFETVALHETGHALSQAHFGKVSRTESNGKVHFSPRAVMNAGYSGTNRVIEKTDEAGHCSNWGNWPNN